MSDEIYEKHIHNQNGWVCEEIQLDPGEGKSAIYTLSNVI